jgi:hypothetical protein
MRRRRKQMADLKSSNLQSADYSPETNSLTITFRGGGRYSYADVPESVYAGLLAAPSPGSYFASTIKDKYSFTKE